MVHGLIHDCQRGFMDKPTPQVVGKCLNEGCDGNVTEYYVFTQDPIIVGIPEKSPPPYAVGHYSWQGYKCEECSRQYLESELIDIKKDGKNITMEDLGELLENSEKDTKEDHSPKVVGECAACRGVVVEEVIELSRTKYTEFDIGLDKINYHCKDCGLMYKFPPKNKSE